MSGLLTAFFRNLPEGEMALLPWWKNGVCFSIIQTQTLFKKEDRFLFFSLKPLQCAYAAMLTISCLKTCKCWLKRKLKIPVSSIFFLIAGLAGKQFLPTASCTVEIYCIHRAEWHTAVFSPSCTCYYSDPSVRAWLRFKEFNTQNTDSTYQWETRKKIYQSYIVLGI